MRLLHNSVWLKKRGHFDEISSLSEPAYAGRPIGGERKEKDHKKPLLNGRDQLCSGLIVMLLGVFSLHAETLEERALFYARHAERAFEEAEALQSKLPEALFEVSGMSGKKTRHFLNNLCSLEKGKYLEIGVWKGSTFLAALYGNGEALETATAIENWSQFGSPRREFWEAVDRFLPLAPFTMLEKDAFARGASREVEGPITIYFYDGPHEERDHELAFTHYDAALDEVFIAVVDDWNWERVRNGTKKAFQKLGYRVSYEKELFTGWNGDADGWWNGLYIAVIQKEGK